MKLIKNICIFSSYCPLKFWALKTSIKDKEFCNQDNMKTFTARIEDDE